MQSPANPYRSPSNPPPGEAKQPQVATPLTNLALLTASVAGLITAVSLDVGFSVAKLVIPRLFLGESFLIGWGTTMTGFGMTWIILSKAKLLRPLPCFIAGFIITFGFAFVVKFALSL